MAERGHRMITTRPQSRYRATGLGGALVGIALALGGCQHDEVATASIPDDYKQRHPIAIEEQNRSIVVFVGHARVGLTAVERADVMGLSLGGMTALGLGLAHPDRVRRMVVCDARADNPPPFVASWDDRIAAIERGGMAAIVSGTLERWFTGRASADLRVRAEAMILATAVPGFAGCARALQGLNYLHRLGELTVPVRYVVGSEDMAAPVAAMQAMADATPGARLTVLPGLAHIPAMEDPAAFQDAVMNWLRA